PGSVLGATLLASLPPRSVSLAVGLVVLAGVAMTASGIHLRPRRSTLLAAGVLSGFMGTTAAIGGPPIALIYQHAEGPRLRGTLAGYFVVAAAISFPASRSATWPRTGSHAGSTAGSRGPRCCSCPPSLRWFSSSARCCDA